MIRLLRRLFAWLYQNNWTRSDATHGSTPMATVRVQVESCSAGKRQP